MSCFIDQRIVPNSLFSDTAMTTSTIWPHSHRLTDCHVSYEGYSASTQCFCLKSGGRLFGNAPKRKFICLSQQL